MKNVKKIVLYSIISVILISGVVIGKNKAFSASTKKENSNVVAMVNKIAVEVKPISISEKNAGVSYKATLEANEFGIISTKVSGKVVQILFDNGKQVTKGDPLVILDDQDIRNQLRSAESQLTIAESQLSSANVGLQKLQTNLESAQRNYDRSKALYAASAVSQANFQDVESALKNAISDLEVGKANIVTANANIEAAKVNIDNLNNSLENTIIKAPINGVIDEKNVNVGQMLSANVSTNLGKVEDIASLNAVIQVEQANINSIKVGQKAIVNLNDGKNTSVDGVIKSIDVSADSASRVFNCKIQLDNKDNLLHPGVYVKAEIITDEKAQTLTVPIEALAGVEGSYYVFINNSGTAHKTTVTIGDTVASMVEIKLGLKKEDKVICTNVNTLQDGDKIEVVSK